MGVVAVRAAAVLTGLAHYRRHIRRNHHHINSLVLHRNAARSEEQTRAHQPAGGHHNRDARLKIVGRPATPLHRHVYDHHARTRRSSSQKTRRTVHHREHMYRLVHHGACAQVLVGTVQAQVFERAR